MGLSDALVASPVPLAASVKMQPKVSLAVPATAIAAATTTTSATTAAGANDCMLRKSMSESSALGNAGCSLLSPSASASSLSLSCAGGLLRTSKTCKNLQSLLDASPSPAIAAAAAAATTPSSSTSNPKSMKRTAQVDSHLPLLHLQCPQQQKQSSSSSAASSSSSSSTGGGSGGAGDDGGSSDACRSGSFFASGGAPAPAPAPVPSCHYYRSDDADGIAFTVSPRKRKLSHAGDGAFVPSLAAPAANPLTSKSDPAPASAPIRLPDQHPPPQQQQQQQQKHQTQQHNQASRTLTHEDKNPSTTNPPSNGRSITCGAAVAQPALHQLPLPVVTVTIPIPLTLASSSGVSPSPSDVVALVCPTHMPPAGGSPSLNNHGGDSHHAQSSSCSSTTINSSFFFALPEPAGAVADTLVLATATTTLAASQSPVVTSDVGSGSTMAPSSAFQARDPVERARNALLTQQHNFFHPQPQRAPKPAAVHSNSNSNSNSNSINDDNDDGGGGGAARDPGTHIPARVGSTASSAINIARPQSSAAAAMSVSWSPPSAHGGAVIASGSVSLPHLSSPTHLLTKVSKPGHLATDDIVRHLNEEHGEILRFSNPCEASLSRIRQLIGSDIRINRDSVTMCSSTATVPNYRVRQLREF